MTFAISILLSFLAGLFTPAAIYRFRREQAIRKQVKVMGFAIEDLITQAQEEEFKSSLCRMVVKDKKMYLASPKGQIFPLQCTTSVSQNIRQAWGGYAIASVQLYVTLDDSVKSASNAVIFQKPIFN